MKENKYFLSTALTAVLASALLVCVCIRAFSPTVILPKPDIPNIVLLSAVALLADHYIAKGAKRNYAAIELFSALAFGLLPFAAGFADWQQALKLALVGGAVFTVTVWLYTSIQERLSTGPAAKAAPFFSALGLYLAAQCFAGIIL